MHTKMKCSFLLSGIATVVAFATAAAAAPSYQLPACSDKDIGNCTCPYGTQYQASTTYAIVGTNAQDFQNLYGSCTSLFSPNSQTSRLLVYWS